MTSLVTGSKGFLGKHLMRRIDAVGVDLKEGNDASVMATLKKAVKKPDVVIHLAAQLHPENDKDIKLHRTVSEYCMETGAYAVYASSASIYKPKTLYAIQKLYGEMLFERHDSARLRFFNIYGPGGSGVVDIFKRAKKKVTINGGGSQKRDFVHVEDVVEAILIAVEKRYVGKVDIGTGYPASIIGIAQDLDKEIERDYDADEGVHYSVAKLNSRFGWEAKKELRDYYEKT